MFQLLRSIKNKFAQEPALPEGAIAEMQADQRGLPERDPGC